MIYNLTNISVCFPSKRFPPRFLVTLPQSLKLRIIYVLGYRYEHAVSSCESRECDCCIFCIFTYIFIIYSGNEMVQELRVVARWRICSEQTHENLRRYSNKTDIHEQTTNSQIVQHGSIDLSWPLFFNRNIYHVCHKVTKFKTACV